MLQLPREAVGQHLSIPTPRLEGKGAATTTGEGSGGDQRGRHYCRIGLL
jgi:hypothetical protein